MGRKKTMIPSFTRKTETGAISAAADDNGEVRRMTHMRRAGQVIPRGKRTFLLRIFLGRDATTGKRRYRNVNFHGTKTAAQTRLNSLLRDASLGLLVEPARTRLGEYLDQWLEGAAKVRVRPRTLQGYKELLGRYIRPDLGKERLSKLTPLQIQRTYAGMLDNGLSAKTVRHAHGVLRAALNQAVKWRLLVVNPALVVELPKTRKKEMQALSPEQATRFLAHAANDRLGALFSLALTTGMRPGEYLGLQWKDIDLKKGAVVVRRTLVPQSDGGWEFAEPKTAQSARTIPLPQSVTCALIEHRKEQAEEKLKAGQKYEDHDLVFAGPKGHAIQLRNLVNRHFKPILKQAKLPGTLRLYDLRHSCATLLLAQGEHPKVVSERLGHASITLTLDTYSHVLPTMQQQAADRLEAVLFGGAGGSSIRAKTSGSNASS
jgi:integrase